MFSLSYISPHIFLNQSQPPYLVDPKYKNYFAKTKSSNTASNWRSLPISKDLSFLTHSHTLSASPANVDSSNNMLSYDADPTNQPLDSSTIGRWLQSCSNVEEIRKVHAVVIKCMKEPVVFVNNNLISVYIKFGNLVAARRWLHGNSQTYVSLLKLCSRTCDYDLGRQLHGYIVKSQVSNVILDCTILHFYARCGDLDSAFEVFDRMKERDLIAWTTMITACSQNRRGQEAFVMLSEMLLGGLDPNEFTVCSVLNACGEEKELRFGKQLHCTVAKKAYDLDVYVETSLVDMYAKCGQIEDARMLFDRMKRKNAITWNTILAGYARNGLGEEAIRLFRMMKRLKVSVNNLTMVSLLRACGLLRAISTGKELHAQIFRNFEPNNIFIGSALVWLYCKSGDYASASKVLQSLPDKDVVSWTTMISGCAHLGHEYEALEYLKEMLGEEAIQVFDSMPERNLVSWRAMIVAYAKNGHCSEALKLMYRMQAEGIEVDDYILSTVLTTCGDFKWEEQSSSERCLHS
ncbi:UNVERIFIED_CONTAM: Pentatricopeptide repeat-containing protein, chloroplastic [Sesamum radiatum]|uniref:Pentatricopeptide repeat-containing protein, chloroplastic n=1 Tax=Sesamum radiatum TaxID=300843 RepID=A0AAW2M0V2_SESRA